jgi:hypothetical protein
VSATKAGSFVPLYHYYFPKNTGFVSTQHRKWFDKEFLSPTAPEGLSRIKMYFYWATRGREAGFRSFVHSPYRGGDGEFGET